MYVSVPLQVSVGQQVIAALRVVVLQGLAVRKVIGSEGKARRSGEGLPIHPHRTTEARHCRGGRQQQDFRCTPPHTHARTTKTQQIASETAFTHGVQ